MKCLGVKQIINACTTMAATATAIECMFKTTTKNHVVGDGGVKYKSQGIKRETAKRIPCHGQSR